MNSTKTFRICTICMPVANIEGGDVILKRFLKIISSLTEQSYLITGGNLLIDDPKIKVIKYAGNWDAKSHLWIRIIKHFTSSIKISLLLIKLIHRYDIVVFYIGTQLYIFPAIIAKIFHKKIIMMHQGSWANLYCGFRTKWFGFGIFLWSVIFLLETLVQKLSDRIIVESKSVTTFIGLSNNRKIVVGDYYYVDTNIAFIKKPFDERRNIVGYMGQLHERKGVMSFVKSMPLILTENNNVEFILIGTGELFNTIKSEIAIKEWQNRVKLTNWIHPQKVPEVLNDLRLLVLPSLSEGLPGSIRDAMACGTPVLATSVGGIPDLIKDGETGFILESNSPECIAIGVKRALQYPRLEEVIRNGRILIEKEYSYEPARNRYEKILNGL